MAYVESFKDLKVWQRAMEVVVEVYAATDKLPGHELYVLGSQMRRSAVSIPSNIAEGKKRRTKADFVKFLNIAESSAAELETQLLLAERIYPELSFGKAMKLLEEVEKMLAVMLQKLD